MAGLQRSTEMNPILILVFLVGSLCQCLAVVVSQPVSVGAFVRNSTGFDLNEDSIDDLLFGGSGFICTADVPTSSCTGRLAILGSDSVEFLLSVDDRDFAIPLSDGSTLTENPDQGSWGNPENGRLSISVTMSQRFPDTDPYRNELLDLERYLIGFRIINESGMYRYGWLDVDLQGSVVDLDGSILGQVPSLFARTLHLESLPGQSVQIAAVPELSSSCLMLASIVLLCSSRRRG